MKIDLLEPRYQAMSAQIIDSLKVQQDLLEQHESLLNGEFTALSNAERLTGGRCNSVYKINFDSVDRVLKISTGLYRTIEMKREVIAIKSLMNQGCRHIVPNIIKFKDFENHAYLVEDYIEGETVRKRLRYCESKKDRLEVWKRLGQVLDEIHKVYQSDDIKSTWLNGQLEIAKLNMEANLLDPEEFEEEIPEEALEWLILNKPKREQISLLHGDYRTKNVMIDNNKNYKVMDWGFVDIGDPYYDLAIIDFYFQDSLDRESFYTGYKHNCYNKELIEYYTKLSKFTNI